MPIVRMEGAGEIEFPDNMGKAVIEKALLKLNSFLGIGGPEQNPQGKTIAEAQAVRGPTAISSLSRDKQLKDEAEFFRKENFGGFPIDPGSLVGLPLKKLGKEIVKGVAPGSELMAINNLTAKNLEFADNLGGLAVPSIGVIKSGQPLESFGEITLLSAKDLAKPSGSTQVISADAFTGRFPTTKLFLSQEESNKLRNFLSEGFGDDVFFRGVIGKDNRKIIDGLGLFDNILDDGFASLEFQDLTRAKFLREKGLLPDIAKLNDSRDFPSQMRTIIEKNDLGPELREFAESIPDRLGLEGTPKIFKGFTPAGNQKFTPLTLENAVKEAKKKAQAGGESFSGLGSMRAELTPPFKNLTEMKAARDRIVPEAEVNIAKDRIQDKFFALTDELSGLSKFKNDNPFMQTDAIVDHLAEIGTVGPARVKAILERNFNDVSDDIVAKVNDLVREARESPTAYFEAKPKRAVALEEFKGAIIPKEASEKTRQILRKRGITKIFEFGSPEERIKLFQKFPELMFGAGGLAVGAEALQDKNNGVK